MTVRYNNYSVTNQQLRANLERFSETIGRPIVVTGGNRSTQSNAANHGAPRSTHLSGRAVDIAVPGWTNLQTAEAAARSGLFHGIGHYAGSNIHGAHVHLDVGRFDGDSQERRWTEDHQGHANAWHSNLEVFGHSANTHHQEHSNEVHTTTTEEVKAELHHGPPQFIEEVPQLDTRDPADLRDNEQSSPEPEDIYGTIHEVLEDFLTEEWPNQNDAEPWDVWLDETDQADNREEYPDETDDYYDRDYDDSSEEEDDFESDQNTGYSIFDLTIEEPTPWAYPSPDEYFQDDQFSDDSSQDDDSYDDDYDDSDW